MTYDFTHNIAKRVIDLGDWQSQNFPFYIEGICSKADRVLLTGSRYIVNDPSFEHNDTDIMILVNSKNFKNFCNDLISTGFVLCGDAEYETDVMKAYRKHQYNILITDSEDYFIQWAIATNVATKLKLTSKLDRISLFQGFIDQWDFEVNTTSPSPF